MAPIATHVDSLIPKKPEAEFATSAALVSLIMSMLHLEWLRESQCVPDETVGVTSQSLNKLVDDHACGNALLDLFH